MIKAQKIALFEKLKEVSNLHIVYPGVDVKKLTIEQIPGIDDMKLSKNEKRILFSDRSKAAQSTLHNHLKAVLDEVRVHPCAEQFLEPIDVEEFGAIGYYDVVKNPIDLRAIKEKLDQGDFYVTKHLFRADFMRMVENCKEYYGEDNAATQYAIRLERLVNNIL